MIVYWFLRFVIRIVLPFLVAFEAAYNYYWDFLDSKLGDYLEGKEYDFIVVGGGSAGSVVANRLSKNNKVLLIEAGGQPLLFNNVPVFAPYMLHRPGVDWMYETVPQRYSHFGHNSKISRWPRGKLLGGSSNLNFMLYVRGHPKDYEYWANLTGDESWRYDNILPYFKKSLDYHGGYQDEMQYGATPYGYLHVERQQYEPLYDHFVAAGKELGLDEVDLNGPQREGLGRLEVTTKNGERFGTYASFIRDFQHRTNLKISKYSQVTKIKFDKNNRAEGVYFQKNGEEYFAKARKEVILSAGVVESPKILMLSGVGPEEHLEDLGIKYRVDLPAVGQHLKDHLIVPVYPFIVNDTVTLKVDRDFSLQTFADYLLHGKGPISTPLGIHSHGFITSSIAKAEGNHNWPDIQFYFSAIGLFSAAPYDLARFSNIKLKSMEKYLEKGIEPDSFMFMVSLARVKSFGEIRLASRDPNMAPVIDPRYLEDSRDLKVLAEGVKFVVKMAEETESFKRLNSTLNPTPFPGCEHHRFKSDAYFECFVRHTGITLYHHCGTCSMGKGVGDPKAVLDSKLRVLKTIGLRVADASVFPEIPNGNVNAPVIMVAEKAADLIREYWSEQYLVCLSTEPILPVKYSKCFYSKIV